MADTKTHLQELFAQALNSESNRNREQLSNAVNSIREEMERQSLRLRDLMLAQPPLQLLGYLIAMFHMHAAKDATSEDDDGARPSTETIQTFQFALEYLHAVWSCHANLVAETTSLDEANAAAIFDLIGELGQTTMMYCMVSSTPSNGGSGLSSTVEMQAKSTWVLIRGHRYQVLEEEFFSYVLEPHADALLSVYGMGFREVAAGIQAIANSARSGFSNAAQLIHDRMEEAHALMTASDLGLSDAIEKLKDSEGNYAVDVSGAIHDIFHGGICNLSKHTNLTSSLLEDLCYLPGENTEFFADGHLKGTPLRTLPALIKPGIKLGDDFYMTDGQFIRDSAYRAIQRGLIGQMAAYRDQWNQGQKKIVEQAYPRIFARQFAKAAKYSEVHFKDHKSGQWVETDLVMTIDDVLLVVEAKAGVMAMHSPATNFDRHERKIRGLIVDAYTQCKRFVEYLASAREAPIHNLIDGKYVEVGRLKLEDFRTVLPVGLTIEAFTPFSAMCKEFADVQPILGKHPFVSMSVDDLFVLNRFLPSTGELLHYLEVRQQVAGIPQATLYDEIDHLGAYIQRNRFDIEIREQLREADGVLWDSFSEVVDRHFEGDHWDSEAPPRQDYPDEWAAVLESLDKQRPPNWLAMDSLLRDLSSSGRANFAMLLGELKATLPTHPIRRFSFTDECPMQVWLCRAGARPSPAEMRDQAEIACLISKTTKIPVLQLWYDKSGNITGVVSVRFSAPTVFQPNFSKLAAEAERQRARKVSLNPKA